MVAVYFIFYFIATACTITIIVLSILKFKKSNENDINDISTKIKNVINGAVIKTNEKCEKLKICEYCGGSYEGTKCPHCGATEIK